MCICAKIYEVTTQAKKYLENDDHAIVIGLQSTGEAGMEVALEELAVSAAEDAGRKIPDFEDMTLSGLVSTSASIMTNFVRNHFPVSLPPPEIPKVPDMPPNGFANEALALLTKLVNIPIIASGGAGNIQHFIDCFKESNADATLAASVFHFKEIEIKKLKEELRKNNIPVRI